ncbi:MAG: Coenzyme F420 hydrogenase/dehydrogenase, beta subunit C-terminal domain [Oscillospiraceae bacterium]|nr:Coenzyme F420 hydrogenase/dehydrogenase, beta subunit C-terminal domain [Oscillospiraceae bacterium]
MQEGRPVPVLFKEKKDCCACCACMNACPKDAIKMQEDECGFLYPVIDPQQCIRCGKCQKACAYQNIKETNTPFQTWVAVSKEETIVMNAASGGVFSALATGYFKEGGFVSGAVFDKDFTLYHIITEQSKFLSKLRGSKYTQSSIGYVLREIKKKLLENKQVLFCGTPCQVAGLKSYLGKEYANLLTIDLICHGVPSNRSFKDYIHHFEKKNNIQVKSFTFRDKQVGWGKNGSIITQSGKRYKLFETAQSYFYYFAYSIIMRENCYTCKYACSHRPGDLTIGDYWGIQKEHPELLNKQNLDESKGVSVIIVNTQKGVSALQKYGCELRLYESSFEKAARGNAQLNKPTAHQPKREDVLSLYAKAGWEAVDDKFQNEIGIKKYSGFVKSLIPRDLKRVLKRFIKN